MGKLADQITADCCGSLLDDKAQLVRDVAALESRCVMLTEKNIELNAEYVRYHVGLNTDTRSTCRTIFNTMYKADPKHKEQVWANLCLSLGIEA
jgi:hypothetical protein